MSDLWRSGRFRFWLLCLGIFVAAGTLDRIYYASTAMAEAPHYWPDLPFAFLFGLFDDILMGAILGSPFLFGLYIWPRLFDTQRWLAHAALVGMTTLFVFIKIAEFFYWREFDSRFNRLLFDYLVFPEEATLFLIEAFDLLVYILPIILVGTLFWWLLRDRLNHALDAPPMPVARRWALGSSVCLGLLAIPVALVGPTQFSDHRKVNEVAANGFHSLVFIIASSLEDYEELYPEIPEEEAVSRVQHLLGRDGSQFTGETAIKRMTPGDPTGPKRKLNVVLILSESFGMSLVDGPEWGQETNTPHFLELAKEGVFFTNLYASGSRTTRGVEAVLSGIAPLPGISTSRRSESENMITMASMLEAQGYETAFMYAGNMRFDDMGRFWREAGFDQVLDIDNIQQQDFATTWGVADEYLFAEALRRLDARPADAPPIFFGMLSVSNHMPFTYPEGRIDMPPGAWDIRHSARYADWAIANFIEQARSRPWFKDTMFVVVADHGPRIHGNARVPATSYRVPLLIYAPGLIAPRRVDTLGSSMDTGPTVLAALGLDFINETFGKNLLAVPEGEGWAVMEHDHALAIAENGRLAIIPPHDDPIGFELHGGPADLPVGDAPDTEEVRNTLSIFQTAWRLFYSGGYHVRVGKKSKKD